MKVRMIGIFPWIMPFNTRFALVCTRAKAMNHWVTKKDDLFSVSPTRLPVLLA